MFEPEKLTAPAELIPIDSIIIPPTRRPPRDVGALVASVATIGLVHPITVTTEMRLVAGRRRVEAHRVLGLKEILARVMTLDAVDAEILEIDENFVRANLTVLERCQQRARRKALYEARYPHTRHGGAPGRPGGGKVGAKDEIISSFASESAIQANVSPRTIQHEVFIATELAEDVCDIIRETPIADSKNDLLKLARLEPEHQRRVAEKLAAGEAKHVQDVIFAEAKEKVAAESQHYPEAALIRQADALAFLESLQPASADLLLTDPPYRTHVDDIMAFVERWVPLALSRVKSTGRAYICTGAYPEELHAYLQVLAGLDELRLGNVLVWTYRNTLGPSPKDDYNLNWQAIFHLRGRDAPPLDCPLLVEKFAVQDIRAPDGRHGDRHYTWQKPDELAERLVRHSTAAGALVVDPFAGSGTFLLAAARLGRRALGCDQSEEALRIAVERGCRREA